MKKFINREAELQSLRRDFGRDGGSLYILYGRRRLGKTTLLRRFAQDVPSVYHMADRGTEKDAISLLAHSMADALDEPTLASSSFNDWYALFAAFDRFRPKHKICLILDEYQYLTEIQPAFSSILQRWWDEHWSSENIMLVLCGSVMSLMYKETLSRESPLFGRRTSQWLIEPIRFRHICEFVPKLSHKKQVELWALTGGVPRYLELAKSAEGMNEALLELVLSKDGPLYAEARFLLQEEVTVANVYWSLLRVIGSGASRISEIAGRVGMPANKLTRYLAALQDLGYVRRIVSVTEKNPQKSKRGIYTITDPFLRLWFGVVSRYESLVEFGRGADALKMMRPALDSHMSWCYEVICRQYIEDHASDFGVVKVGRCWDRTCEIDVAAVNSEGNLVLAGECKMSKRAVGLSVLNELREKVQHFCPSGGAVKLVVFSIGGFTDALVKVAKNDGVVLKGGRLLRSRVQ
jgi:AAA+ ATPase superfamily predicted ATPase